MSNGKDMIILLITGLVKKILIEILSDGTPLNKS